jgi:hypothetical protein
LWYADLIMQYEGTAKNMSMWTKKVC